jgi:DNA topoisomerase-3
LGSCPRCGQPVREGQQGFFCDDRGCGFAIWKDNRFFGKLKKRLDRKTAAALLTDGRVFLTGLHSEKSGKSFDAFVVMAVEKDGNKRVNFSLSFDNLPKKGKKK